MMAFAFFLAGQTGVPATQGGRGETKNVGKDKPPPATSVLHRSQTLRERVVMFRNACLISAVLALSSALPAQDSPYFRFDFEDGVVPPELEPGRRGCSGCKVEAGSFIIPRNGFIDNSFVWFEPDDFIVNTQVRFIDDVGKEDSVTILVRDTVPLDSVAPSYYAGISTFGELTIQRITPGQGFRGVGLDPRVVVSLRDSGLDPINEDVHLQFMVDGTTLSLSAWADGQPMPSAPQLVLEDDRYLESSYIMINNSSFDAGPGATVAPGPLAKELLLIMM